MGAAGTEELYPIVVAQLADEESCAMLRDVAARGGVVIVPLLSAPVDRRVHLLEAYAPGGPSELFLAEPAGPPTDAGFPLRLRTRGQPEEDLSTHTRQQTHDTVPEAVLRTNAHTQQTLSQHHTRDLLGATAAQEKAEAHLGRELGGGKYRIDAIIGAGGMGVVYRGTHRQLHKQIAIKILHPSFRSDVAFAQRFYAEALTMSRIDHPNVTRVLDFGQEEDGLLYLAMEFLDGVDLQTLVRSQGGVFELERLVNVMIQVTAGLGHVHRHDIIHRDVKPRNIVIVAGLDEDHETPTEVAKVCDFGIALSTGGMNAAEGTPAYMSPEQVSGRQLDARSDVYAVGVVMYELATGRLPFAGRTGQEIAQLHVSQAPEPPSRHVESLDPLLEAIILKALSKDPEARQPSMRHLRAELRELLSPAVIALESPSVPPEPASSSEGLPEVPELDLAMDRPSAPPAPQPARGADAWVENRHLGMASFFVSVSDRDREIDAAWLAQLVATVDIEALRAELSVFETPVRKVLERGDAQTLAAVITAMRTIIKRDPTAAHAKYAGRVLRIFRDASVLTPFVESALGGVEESPALQHILVETQTAAGHALCNARPRHTSATARARFVALARAIGPAALPSLAATLRACLARGERAGPIVEDLLHAMPAVADEEAGSVVAELLRGGPVATTTSAALSAIAALWGERARPLLLGAFGHPDPGVVIAAIRGLRYLRAIDSLVVRRLDPIVLGLAPAIDELRVLATEALGEALPDAREDAAATVSRAFAADGANRRPLVSVVLARSLLALGVPHAAAQIQNRAASAPEDLRQHLLALVR